MRSLFLFLCPMLALISIVFDNGTRGGAEASDFSEASHIQDRWIAVHQKCQSDPQLYVNDAIFEQIRRGESPTLPSNFDKHAFCMMSNLGLQDQKGQILRQRVEDAVSQSTTDRTSLNRIVSECSGVHQGTREKTASALFECFRKHHINIGQF